MSGRSATELHSGTSQPCLNIFLDSYTVTVYTILIMKNQETLSIQDLADAAEVPVRTIRYYISEGILQGPEGRGKSASYSEEHLLRLKAARLLAEQRIPLEEIRRTLPGLSKGQLLDLLNREERQKRKEVSARGTSPAEYIQALIAREEHAAYGLLFSQAAEPSAESEETWRRYILRPGIELHVSSSATGRHGRLIQKVLRLQEVEQ